MRRVWRALSVRRAESAPGESVPAESILVESVPVESEGWRAGELLTDADLSDFVALRQVYGRADSHVIQVGEGFYDRERQLLSHVEDGVRMLMEVGLATLGEADPDFGRRLVTVTPDGRRRYEELCERQGYPPYPDPRLTTGGWQF